MTVTVSLELENVGVYRDDLEDGAEQVVSDFSLAAQRGEKIFLVGPNGAGKTSLMLAIVGALRFSGRIEVGGVRVERKSLELVRKRVAFVFADPSDQLFCDTVEEEVAFGPKQLGLTEGEAQARVHSALASVNLTGKEGRSPLALSQGEQRRLVLATALALAPDVILCDEPTASLDPVARGNVLRTLSSVASTLLVATHDLDAALELGSRVILMKAGKIVADGPAEALLSDGPLLEKAGLALPFSLARR